MPIVSEIVPQISTFFYRFFVGGGRIQFFYGGTIFSSKIADVTAVRHESGYYLRRSYRKNWRDTKTKRLENRITADFAGKPKLDNAINKIPHKSRKG